MSLSRLLSYDGSAWQRVASDSAGVVSVSDSSAASSANQSTMIASLDAIQTACELLDNCVGGTEFQCDVISSALPSGASSEATLASVDGKITTCNTGAVVVSSSALPAGASSEATLASVDGKITTCDTGNCTVVNRGENNLQATSLYSNGSLAVSTFSTSIDMNVSGDFHYRNLTIYGKMSTGARLHLAFSSDDTNFYIHPDYAGVHNDGSNNNFCWKYEDVPARYVRVYNDDTSVASALYLEYCRQK